MTQADQRTINKAKKILMKEQDISEPEAYKQLRCKAMDGRVKIIDVASLLLYARGKK